MVEDPKIQVYPYMLMFLNAISMIIVIILIDI